MEPLVARKTWRTLEPYHGLVYFAPEAGERYAALGLPGFGGYFPSRAAAMGAVGPEVVVATFFNFRPSLVLDALPRAWDVAPPPEWLDARLAAIDGALRRVLGDDVVAGDDVARAAALAGAAADAAGRLADGRPLAAAHAALPVPAEPHLALWRAITVLREHRGDGHVSCLVEAGVDGCGALVLHAESGEVPRGVLQSTRGWSDDEWDAAAERLAGRDAGLRASIERRTDELAAGPWAAIGEEGCEELRRLVRPLSKAIVAGGELGRASAR